MNVRVGRVEIKDAVLHVTIRLNRLEATRGSNRAGKKDVVSIEGNGGRGRDGYIILVTSYNVKGKEERAKDRPLGGHLNGHVF